MPLKSGLASRVVALLRVRPLLFNLHLVLGLTAGLLLCILGLSGSLLVFRDEIDGMLEPSLRHVHPSPGATAAPLEQVVETVHHAYPDARLQHIFVADEPDQSHEIGLAETDRRLYVDPYSLRILGEQRDDQTFTGWLFALHTKLLSGEKGELVVGYGGMILLFLSVSGVYLWWPSHLRQVPDRLRVKWGASAKRRNYDLHRSGGFYAVALLTLLSLTGITLVFSEWFAATAYRMTGAPPPPAKPKVKPPSGDNASPLPLGTLLQQVEIALPGGQVRRVTFPLKPTAPLVVRKRFPGEIHPNGMNYLYLDPYTGKVLRVDRVAGAAPGQQLINLRYPVHIGRWGGLLTRLLHAVAGLMPTVLFVTGCIMWWNRVGSKRRRPTASPITPRQNDLP